MASTVNLSQCHWIYCPAQPVALAAMGTLPDQAMVFAYCQEHISIITVKFKAGELHGRQGRVDEMLIQDIT